jgi:hypothetical protein
MAVNMGGKAIKSWKSALKHGGRGILLYCTLLFLPSAFVLGQTREPPPANTSQPLPAKEGEQTFVLNEVSIFDVAVHQAELQQGQTVPCTEMADANVVAYPRFKSQHPLYGTLRTYPPEEQSVPPTYRFALDESGGTGQGYDQLYFDLNRDNNLTNDKVMAVQKNPPARARLDLVNTRQIVFETIALPFPFGAQGQRPMEVLPRLMVFPDQRKMMCFIATEAREGQIQVDGRQYDVLLAHRGQIAGWFDHPGTAIYVVSFAEAAIRLWGTGSDLMGTHHVGATFCQFSATPAGDRLTLRFCTGPLGTFEVGPAGRKVGRLTMSGSLRSATTTVPIGVDPSSGRPLSPSRSYKLPVDDYRVDWLSVQLDALSVTIVSNYHLDGKPLGKMMERQHTYDSIAIRQDKPFVLEFSSKAEVLFALPARDHRVKLGEQLKVEGVLVDPILDVAFRQVIQGKQLDPKVTIMRANGEIVAEGTMPFG